jgi:Flp pilus assembly pilin Flp
MSDLITGLWVRLSNRLYAEDGQAVTEYALVLALVALIAGVLLASGIGDTIVGKITSSISKV